MEDIYKAVPGNRKNKRKKKPHAKGEIQKAADTNTYDLPSIDWNNVVAELLQSNPDALKTNHEMRLSCKAPLPSLSEKPLYGITDSKDYVTSNAVDVILAPARHRGSTPVDYLKKSDFGKIPKYMERIKLDLEKENRHFAKLREQEAAAERAKRRIFTREERDSVISDLKAKWSSVNSEYQRITHMTVLDTIGKVRRKEHYEAELKQLEKDMELLGRSEDLYIDLES